MKNQPIKFIRPLIFTVTILMAGQTGSATASWAHSFTALVRPSYWAAAAAKVSDKLRSIQPSTWITTCVLASTTMFVALRLWHCKKECRQLRQQRTASQQRINELNAQHERNQAQITEENKGHQAAIAALTNQINELRTHDQAQIDEENRTHQAAIAALTNQVNELREAQHNVQINQLAAPAQPQPAPIVVPHQQPVPVIVQQASQQADQPAPARTGYFEESDISHVFCM